MSSGLDLRRLGLIAVAGIVYYVVAVAALAVLHPEISVLERPISTYQRGRYPLLAATTFLAFATALAALNIALTRTLPRSSWSTLGSIFLWVAVAGIVVAGIFPDAPMHNVGSLMTFPSSVIGAALLSLAVARTPPWRRAGGLLLILAISSVALFLAGILVFHRQGLAGLGQRLFFGSYFAWITITAFWIARKAGPPAAEPRHSSPN
jgi:hypothetical protein